MSKHRVEDTIISIANIEAIISDEINRHDVKGEDGQPLTDDLYMLRSSEFNEICLNAADRIHKASLQLARAREFWKEEHGE